MNEYYIVKTVCTGKAVGSKEEYTTFDKHTKTFQHLHEIEKYLQETYGDCKRKPQYRTHENGRDYICGYVYCFHNSDISHFPVEKWLQQDWVSISHITEVPVLGNFRQVRKNTRRVSAICCNECGNPLTDREAEVYPLQWQHSGDMYCDAHEIRTQFIRVKQEEQHDNKK